MNRAVAANSSASHPFWRSICFPCGIAPTPARFKWRMKNEEFEDCSADPGHGPRRVAGRPLRRSEGRSEEDRSERVEEPGEIRERRVRQPGGAAEGSEDLHGKGPR